MAGGKSLEIYALYDSGANICAIQEDLVEELGLNELTIDLTLNRFGDRTHDERRITCFEVSSLDGKVTFQINGALVDKDISTDREKIMTNNDIKQYEHMKGVTLTDLKDKRIGVILSAEYGFDFHKGTVKAGLRSQPLAIETSFGWSIIGPRTTNNDEAVINSMDVEKEETQEEMETLIRTLFRKEFIAPENERYPSEQVHDSQYDKHSLQQMLGSIVYNKKTGHYRMAMP